MKKIYFVSIKNDRSNARETYLQFRFIGDMEAFMKAIANNTMPSGLVIKTWVCEVTE